MADASAGEMPNAAFEASSAPHTKPPCRVRLAIISGSAAADAATRAAESTPGSVEGVVRFSIDSQTSMVGVPFHLTVYVQDGRDYGPPVFQGVPGVFDIQLLPGTSRSERTSIVNGTVTRSTSESFVLQLTPLVPGTHALPAISIVVDGREYPTPPADLVVQDGPRLEELASAVVESSNQTVWLGEATELELVVTLRATQVSGPTDVLSAADMWSAIDLNGSDWGPFSESILNLVQTNRIPRGRIVPGEGPVQYQYRIPVQFFADKSGSPDLSNVRIRIRYPLAASRQRDFFGPRVAVTQRRLLTLEPSISDLEVLPLPMEGRPASFTGAVGTFRVVASARPTAVLVGDPITLTVVVRDESGASELNSVQPPNLAATPGLERDFAIPDGAAGGVIQDNVKVFTQTLRALHDGIDSIPALEFSWFDPATASYETAHTAPIPITVRPAERMARGSIEGRKIDGEAAGGDDGAGGGPDDSPDAGHDWRGAPLLVASSIPSQTMVAVALGIPPAAFAAIAVVVGMRRRAAANPAAGRRRRAVARALSRLKTDDPGIAIAGLVEDRRNLVEGTLTPTDIVRQLGDSSDLSLAEDVDGFLNQCERARYASTDAARPDPARARSLIGRIAKSLPLVVLLPCLGMLIPSPTASAAQSSSAIELTAPTLPVDRVADAHRAYEDGLHLRGVSDEAARLRFRAAALQYSNLIEAGARNPGLYLDAGNAYLAAGDLSRARAAYLAGQRLDPGDARLHQALQTAAAVPMSSTDRLVEDARTWWQSIPSSARWSATWFSWLLVWSALAAGVLLRWPSRVPWKAIIAATGTLAVSAGATVVLDQQALPPDSVAVVIGQGATLRTGTGESFPSVPGPELHDGTIVSVVEEHRAWMLVRLAGGREGWLPKSQLIRPGP